ncbi:MAG: transporter substrate-binding domain-containing protein [Methylophagaceae bacterium]
MYFLYLLIISFYSSIALAQDEITVGTIERPPFAFHDERGNLTGFTVELWQKIADRIDIDFVWQQQQSFSTLISDTVSNKTDLAVANISITASREQQADFSHSIFESGMAIAVKRGASASYFTLIWESGIVLFLGGAFLLLLLIAHVVWFFERNIDNPRHDYFRDDYVGGVWDAFWWAFIIMTMGGFENEVPQKLINRMLAIFWIIVSLFFISTLTAKITTALTVAELRTGIVSYKDLLGKKVGVTEGSSHQKFLQDVGIRTVAYPSLEALYADLRGEKINAIVADLPILSHYATHDGASWMLVAGDTFNIENYGIIFPEESPYLERVDTALLQLREEGVYRELHEKYFGKEF